MFEVPNLDDMPPDELLTLAFVLTQLTQYALVKMDARRERIAGNIQKAQLHEGMCQAIHDRLPEWARW